MKNDDADGLWAAVRKRMENIVVEHKHYVETKKKILRALKTHNLVLLVGASGVGKTTLVRDMVRELNEASDENPRAIYVRPPSAHSGQFGWKDVFRRWADAMGVFGIDRKIDRRRIVPGTGIGRSPSSFLQGTVDTMRDFVFKETVNRGIETVFLDEAGNLLAKRPGRSVRSQLDVLRDMSDESSEVGRTLESGTFSIVLFSTFSVIEGGTLNLSPELTRRMKKLEFPRYDPEAGVGSADFSEYLNIVKVLLDEIPEELRPTLSIENLRELLRRSLGCVGILHKWVLAATVLCEEEGAKRLEWRHFGREAGLSDGDIENMALQTRLGEEAWEQLVRGKVSGFSGKSASGTVSSGHGGKSLSGKRGKRSKVRIGLPAPNHLPISLEGDIG